MRCLLPGVLGLALALVFLTAACGSDAPSGADAAGPADARADAAAAPAAAPDAATDAADDVARDALPDGGADPAGDADAVPADAPSDAPGPSDVSPEVPPDAAPDVPPEVSADVADDVLEDIVADVPLPGAPFEPLPALETCAPTAAACDEAALETATFAALRPNVQLPYAPYPEAGIPDYPDGGRVQVTGVAAVGGTITAVEVNGADAAALAEELYLNWWHVWPRTLVAGAPVWVAFHSHATAFSPGEPLSVVVRTDEGVAVEATLTLAAPPAPLTYVTTADDHRTVLVHVRNGHTAPLTLSRLLLDGRDVTAAACVPSPTLAPGATALWTVPLCDPLVRGAAWTVVAEWAEGVAPAVGAGRVLPEHFPIFTWPQSQDCPFPGGNAANLEEHLTHGFDTFFLMKDQYDYDEVCHVSRDEVLAAALPFEEVWIGVGNDDPVAPLDDRTVRMVGDEADAEIADNPRGKAGRSLASWLATPQVPTFLGGSRNRHVHAFAGVADVQGMDVYIAACAPHIIDWGFHPPLASVHDYGEVTRANHMPLPTWTYAQGFSSAWNNDLFDRQPNPAEAQVAAASVLAAGAKGLLYFQTNLEMAAAFPDTWAAIGAVNAEVKAVRGWLREGDPLWSEVRDDDAVVAAVRARDAIVVVVANARVEQAPTDVGCLAGHVTGDPYEWILGTHTTDLAIPVPPDVAVADVFEVRDGVPLDVEPAPRLEGRTVWLPRVPLSHDRARRFFVLATDPAARATAAAAAP